MSKLRLKISMSLDGYVAGPNQSVDNPLGIGGTRLHEWAVPLAVWREPHGEEGGEVNESTHSLRPRAARPGRRKYVHIRHRRIESALDQARRAGGGKDVSLAGGAKACQEYLAADLVDEMEINLVPTLLGSGEPLFHGLGDDMHGLELVRTVAAPNVTHLKFVRR